MQHQCPHDAADIAAIEKAISDRFVPPPCRTAGDILARLRDGHAVVLDFSSAEFAPMSESDLAFERAQAEHREDEHRFDPRFGG